MSELTDGNRSKQVLRPRLLATVSAFTLIASLCATGAVADDADRNTLWIELGGQFEQLSGQGEDFAPAFLAENPNSPAFKPIFPLQTEKAPSLSYGAEGKVSFEPAGSDWVFSAAIRYGRSNNYKHVHQQDFPPFPTTAPPGIIAYYHGYASEANYSDTVAKHTESQAVVDFQVGKDVGLGMFGKNSSGILNFGVRFAQFSSSASVKMYARPNVQFYHPALNHLPLKYFHNYIFQGADKRDFRGVGPLLSWNASTPLLGQPETVQAALDWGANAAILFGRQKESSQHQTTGRKRYQLKTNCCSHTALITSHYVTLYKTGAHNTRIRSVTVPNIGAFAALSIQRANAKISFGYRADFFFGALDGGIDTRKSDTLGFRGPYATISVGVGG